MKHRSVLLAGAILLAAAASAAPRPVWEFAAESNLYAPPLTADLHPAPGLETVVSDSEAKTLRCVGADGKELWAFAGGWKKRLASAAALGDALPDGVRLLAVGNGDGTLVCLDAATGAERWRADAGAVEWGGCVWAELDGAPPQELIAGTADRGVAAFSADGAPLWRWTANARGLLAAADTDRDGRVEIFGATAWGVFCLSPDGASRWEQTTGDDFTGAPCLFQSGREWRVAVSSVDDDYLWCLNAADGAVVWRTPLLSGPDTYSGAGTAVADLDGDGAPEILAPGLGGHVHAVGADGALRWVFQTGLATHIAVSAGDVDGDGLPEVLAASGDHGLYCLDARGRERWRWTAGLRLIGPPTLADVNGDGLTDLLFGGSDRILRCITAGGRFLPNAMPWPSRRGDAAQTGVPAASTVPMVTEERPLFAFGGFEHGKIRDGLAQFDPANPLVDEVLARPRGWRQEGVGAEAFAVVNDPRGGGKNGKSLLLPVGGAALSEYVPVGLEVRSVTVRVRVRGPETATAALVWTGAAGALAEAPLVPGDPDAFGWRTLALEAAPRPTTATHAALRLRAGAHAQALWDDAELTGTVISPAKAEVLVNQAGYDTGAPKAFVVQAGFPALKARFAVVDTNGKEVFGGALPSPGWRITGFYGHDWGFFYRRGDFSSVDAPGTYRVRVTLDEVTAESYPFEIGPERLWQATARPAYRFFWYQRCGMEIPGFHGACHLDDASTPDSACPSLAGGWHDAGDYNKYHNAPYVYGLARAYGLRAAAFDALRPAGEDGFWEELLWGADHVRRMVAPDGSAFGSITTGYGYWGPPERETDNLPCTGDERPAASDAGAAPDEHHAALARMAALAKETGRGGAEAPAETAARSLDHALQAGRRGWLQLSTATDLFTATGDPRHAETARALARELAPGPLGDVNSLMADTLERYDRALGEDHTAVLAAALAAKADSLAARARNPFGVVAFGDPDKPNYFNTPADKGGWRVGTNSQVLEAAALAARALRYQENPAWRKLVHDQFNWVLGVNPFNLSLMEGVGSAFLPTYHHRYTFSGVPRGAVPGSVVNGVTWRTVGDDRPYVDLSGADVPNFASNECWLPHNTHYLDALSALTAGKR
ncbi:MAG TPA: glycoside hydrolase family 9 protein [Candidatus Hydrogenedentes bacterium]|nr:glycoside hydrolase family 9 protein [Candidatus Hydrogenedentota bacterium]